MDGETITWIFLVGGILLMLLEMVIPGGIAFVLGLSGIIVGALRYVGLLEDPLTSLSIWLVSSMALTILIRPIMRRFMPGDTSFKLADEDFEAMDQVVRVVEPINDQDNSGRIRYNGISWQARSMEGEIPAGAEVRIKYRESTTWIVEAIDPIEPSGTQQKQKTKN